MAEEVKVKDMLKFQQEKTTIEKDAREVVDPPFADAIRRGIRANKIKEETLKVEPTPERELNPRLPKMRNGAKEMRLTLDESLFREVKEEDKKLKNESLEEKYFRVSYERKNSNIFVPLVIIVKAENEEQAKEKFHNKYDEEKYETIGITEINEVEFNNWRRKGISLLESAVDKKETPRLYKRAKELADKIKKPVVYGYLKGNSDNLYAIEPREYDRDDEKKFRKMYKAKIIRVAYPDEEIIQKKNLKESVKVGSKIKIVNMEGEPRYKGKEGVVKEIDDMGQLHGTWGGLAVIPEEDEFEILEEKLEKNNIEEELEKLPAVYQVNKIKDNTYELETNWERTHRRAVGNYSTIRRSLEKKFGKDGFRLTYVQDETRDEGKEVHCVLEVEIKKEELTEAHREELDSWEVEELVLYIKNDSELYDKYTKPTVINLARKLNKGIFDKELAAKAFLYVVDAGVRKYRKEFKAEDGYEQFRFNQATREDSAKKLLDLYMEEIEDKAEDLKGKKEFKEAVEEKDYGWEVFALDDSDNTIKRLKKFSKKTNEKAKEDAEQFANELKEKGYKEISVVRYGQEPFIPQEMDKYINSYFKKFKKMPKKYEWRAMLGDTDLIKIDGKLYMFNIESGELVKESLKNTQTRKIKESYRVDPIRTNFDKTLKRENYKENFDELEKILGADELYGGNIEEIKNIRLYQYPEIYKDSVAVKYRYIFDALINGDFYPDDEETKWIRFDTNKMNKFGEHEFIVNAYYDDYGYSISEIDDGVYYVGDEYNCVKSITELLYNAGYEFIIESAEDILTDFTDAPIVDDEDLEENLTEAVEDKKVKFDYALIEFIEGGEDTDTESQKELRKAEKEQTKFTDLDELGDLIFRADEEVKELGEQGYDKLYVDFYGKADDGKEVRVHIYRVDLGDGIGRENHLTNKDKEEIEKYLTKEYNKLEK